MTEQNKNISKAMSKIKNLYRRKDLSAWVESSALRMILKELVKKEEKAKK